MGKGGGSAKRQRTQKRRSRTRAAARGTSAPTQPTRVSVPRPDDLLIIQLSEAEPDTCLVLGELEAGLGQLLPMPKLSAEFRVDLTDRLSAASGLASIGLQGITAATAAQNLYRLTPESVAALKAGATLMKDGPAVLSPIVKSGRIVQQARFIPAAGVGAASVLAALGPAVAMLGLQLQLASMNRKLNEIRETTNDLLLASRLEQWTRVNALVKQLERSRRRAERDGLVSDNNYGEIRGRAVDLDELHQQLSFNLAKHDRALRSLGSASARRHWLNKNAGVLFADAQALALCTYGLALYEGLKAYHSAATEPAAVPGIIAEARVEVADSTRLLTTTLTSLHRQLQLVAAEPGSTRFYLFGQDRAPSETMRAARDLADTVSSLGVGIEPYRVAVACHVEAVPGIEKHLVEVDILGLHLHPEETLEAVFAGTHRCLCMTDVRFFATRRGKPGSLLWSLDRTELAQIRIVDDGGWEIELRDQEKERYRLRVADKDLAEAWSHRLLGGRPALTNR